VAVPHQEVDQASGPFRVLAQFVGRLLACGRHAGGPDDIRVGGAVLDQFDRHVAADPQLLVLAVLASHPRLLGD
jgi:hypothetical protein